MATPTPPQKGGDITVPLSGSSARRTLRCPGCTVTGESGVLGPRESDWLCVSLSPCRARSGDKPQTSSTAT